MPRQTSVIVLIKGIMHVRGEGRVRRALVTLQSLLAWGLNNPPPPLQMLPLIFHRFVSRPPLSPESNRNPLSLFLRATKQKLRNCQTIVERVNPGENGSEKRLKILRLLRGERFSQSARDNWWRSAETPFPSNAAWLTFPQVGEIFS